MAQIIEEEGFSKQIVHLKAGGSVVLDRACDHEYWLVWCHFFKPRSQLVTAHLGHRVVGHYEIEPARLEQGYGFFASAGFRHDVVVDLEQHLDRLPHEIVVVHDEDVLAAKHWRRVHVRFGPVGGRVHMIAMEVQHST